MRPSDAASAGRRLRRVSKSTFVFNNIVGPSFISNVFNGLGALKQTLTDDPSAQVRFRFVRPADHKILGSIGFVLEPHLRPFSRNITSKINRLSVLGSFFELGPPKVTF
jgi:hypothetical protein